MTASDFEPRSDFMGGVEFEYSQWRNIFLKNVLRLFCVLGLFLFGANIDLAKPAIAQIVFFSIIYIALIVATFVPFPYRVKVAVLVLAGEFIGLNTLIRLGPWSDSIVFFLTATVFASILFNKRIDLWIYGANILFLVVAALLDQFKLFPSQFPNLPPTSIADWIGYIADYFVISGALVWALDLLKDEFRSVSEQFSSAVKLLTKDRAELEQRVDERTAGLAKKTEQLRAASYIARQTA
jgi:hypothetical protein